jgi:poly(A) polymerase
MIGDPAMRYREDPVRLVRVVRFAAKLGFTIEKKTAAAMAEAIPLLANVPTSRLFDEMIKLLQTGHALASIEALRTHGLHRGVFPVLEAVYDEQRGSAQRHRFIELALADTDRRVAEGRAVAPSFLLACLLWHDVQTRWHDLRKRGEHPMPALQQSIDAVFDARIGDVSGRGRLAGDMREIWMMQPRFERRQGNSAGALIAQPRFRAGYDFLRLRADAQELEGELADWWEDFSLGDADERDALLELARDSDRQRRQPEPTPAAGGAPAKRRRRRRRSGGARGEDGSAPNPVVS